MIDIHNHILYGIDDGSRSLDESINIIKKAISNGYTDLILTPHYRLKQNFTCDNIEKNKIYNELKKEINKQNLSINIYLGNEITLDEDLFYYLNTDQILSLNKSKYILLELPFNGVFKQLDEAIEGLKSKGYIPIIAHPERYESYKINDFENLISKGVLFQGNISTLFGKYGSKSQKILEKMIKRNMIHFMGSDTHYESHTSYDRVNDAFKIVEELTKNKSIAEDLFINNPKKIINNEDIEIYQVLKNKFKLFGGSR